jgi:PPM family protein phosphatase
MTDDKQVAPVEDNIEITAELEPSELAKEWDKLLERARTVRAVVKFGARTDLGRVRENNEDKFDFFEPDDPEILARKGCFYAVADGMGGHAAGQIASELALKTVVKTYYADTSPDVVSSLHRAVFEANSLIYDAARMIVERSGMGTTLTAIVVRADEVYFAQVGDSRGYLIREGKIRQVTEDHSWVQEQVKRGALTEEEALTSPFRNVITRSLGNLPSVEADIFTEEAKPGDVIVLCSDGLSGNLSADDIRTIVDQKSPSQAAMDLVDTANERGGNDNITTVIVAVKDVLQGDDVPKADQQPSDSRKKKRFGIFG